MADNHILTKRVGNIRGFSTDSIFIRPPNVSDVALNVNLLPDRTTGPRRGYQCQIADVGGCGDATYDNLSTGEVETVTLDPDGLLYKKYQKQIYLYYDGRVFGSISAATQAANCQITTSAPHGLVTGAKVLITGVDGMVELNGNVYTITVNGASTFLLNVNSTGYGAYTSGGVWTISFTNNRYLTFSIFTDPSYVNSGGSITCKVIVNWAAQVNGNQTSTNTITVAFQNVIGTGKTVEFLDTSGVLQSRTVTGSTTTSITISGSPVSVSNNTIINQISLVPFGKGFDVTSTTGIITLDDFITALTATAATSIFGVSFRWNGQFVLGSNSLPAAFLDLVEAVAIPSSSGYTLNYYYWLPVNKTVAVTFPGTADPVYRNSPEYENASFATFDDVLYISNGIDFPQKYDGQTVYRSGIPQPPAVTSISDNTSPSYKPFSNGEVYTYAITYEQIDNVGHLVEGVASNNVTHTVGSTCALDVSVPNIIGNTGWNTNAAIATGGAATVYGPDSDGFYYDLVAVSSSTFNIGDTAFYNDTTCAVVDGAQSNVVTIVVDSGHNVESGDEAIFFNSSGDLVSYNVLSVTDTSITLRAIKDNQFDYVSVSDNEPIRVNKTSKVFGNLAIVNGTQTFSSILVNTATVVAGHTIQIGDTINFVDSNGNPIIAEVSNITPTTISFSSSSAEAFTLLDRTLLAAEEFTSGQINLQRKKSGAATLGTSAPISNNLRINIYRSLNNGDQLFLFGVVPNNPFADNQTFTDQLIDDWAGIEIGVNNLLSVQDSPPVSKYVLSFGNQMIYAGGKRGDPTNDDNVFFSLGSQPENVPPATNFFYVPSTDDQITGVGVAGTTLITTKNRGAWAVSGVLIPGQFSVDAISPGSNVGCVSFHSMKSVGSLLYMVHTNGLYAIAEKQFYPTDRDGNPVPLSRDIDAIFREKNYQAQNQYLFNRSIGCAYTKDNQYLLFVPCQDPNATGNVANQNSIILCYDTEQKNWYLWNNINAAGGMYTVGDDLYFHERRFSGVVGNTANLYKQHRFYRLIDYADHVMPIRVDWKSSWEDLGQPEMRKKFSHAMLYMDRIASLDQVNTPVLTFSTYLDRIPNVQDTIASVTTVDNVQNAAWSNAPWGWGSWAGYQDSFIRINLKRGTVAKSIQVGFSMYALNTSFRFAGFQLEAIPEFRRTWMR